ncbi:MAG: helix-turn-helix transcriptional regulator [Deltaproteobacteria bacterium]|nr:helix-turn-helix transcriptional regulator [Deltaproteobacteria bacterium]
MSQEHLARAAEVSPRTIQRAEAGDPVQSETLRAIASALDTGIQELRARPAEPLDSGDVGAAGARLPGWQMGRWNQGRSGGSALTAMGAGGWARWERRCVGASREGARRGSSARRCGRVAERRAG